jgi:Ecdysteroid kinase-like family
MASFRKTVVPMKCGFKVLCHYDSWITNFMLKFDQNGNSVDAKIIDFECSLWKSPSNDLFTFLFTSVADEFKCSYFDKFIEFYHENLVNCLKVMEYSGHIPTLNELNDDLYENRVLALVCLTSQLVICKYNSSIPFALECFFDGTLNDETLERMLRGELYGKSLKILLPFMEKKGWLDLWTAD